jgi:uncharacterized repeat protein (TIGR01451 family)
MRRAILLLTAMGAMLLMYAGQVLANHIPPDLVIDWHDGPSKASPGETYVDYDAYVYNEGGRTATVPDGTVVAKHTFTGTTSTDCYAESGYTCRGEGTETVEIYAVGDQTIGVGDSVYTSVYATAPTTTGKMTNSVTADPNGVIEEIDDGNNNSDTIATYVGPPPPTDLSVTQTDYEDPVEVGGYLRYTVTVTNNGKDTAFNVVVDDVLSANATYRHAFADGSCNFIATENTVVCPLGDILSGESKEIEVDVTPNAKGTASSTATAFNDNGDSQPSNDMDKEKTTVQGQGGGGDGGGGGDSGYPTITKLKPQKGSETSKRTPLISAEVSDRTTDFEKDGKMVMYLDGEKVEGAYDGSTDTLSYTPPRKLSYGRHTVRVVATDKNKSDPACVSERSWRFSIVRR